MDRGQHGGYDDEETWNVARDRIQRLRVVRRKPLRLPPLLRTAPSPQIVIPSKSPLTMDILYQVIANMTHTSHVPQLISILQTCSAVRGPVEKQLVHTFNEHRFANHRQLAQLCLLLLRHPQELLPILHTLRISGNLHHRTEPSHGCICLELLAKVFAQSTTLANVSLYDAEELLAGDNRLRRALAGSTSLRSLCIRQGVGPATMAMFDALRPGLRELEVNLIEYGSHHDRPPLLSALKGIRSSLEELCVTGGDDRLSIDMHDPDAVWPMVHTLNLSCIWADTPPLVKAFPNLRHLDQGDDYCGDPEDARQYSLSEGRWWPTLDTVHLNTEFLWAAGLTCPVRRLFSDIKTCEADVNYLLADLPTLRPVVLDIDFRMPAFTETPDSGVNPSMLARIWPLLSRTKTLMITLAGSATNSRVEHIDSYMHHVTADIRVPTMEYLSLKLNMRDLISNGLTSEDFDRAIAEGFEANHARPQAEPEHPPPNSNVAEAQGADMETFDETYEEAASMEASPGLDPSSRSVLKEQLGARMTEDKQRDLVSALAQNNHSLRYVNISPWIVSDFLKDNRHWEIVRDSRHEPSYSPVVREVPQEDGDQLWKRFQAADA